MVLAASDALTWVAGLGAVFGIAATIAAVVQGFRRGLLKEIPVRPTEFPVVPADPETETWAGALNSMSMALRQSNAAILEAIEAASEDLVEIGDQETSEADQTQLQRELRRRLDRIESGLAEAKRDAESATANAEAAAVKIAETRRHALPSELMQAYHTHGLSQSRVSFLVSLIFAGFGFALIAGTVVNATLVEDGGDAESTVGLVARTVIEVVSALFFVQSNRARRVMIEFFDKLRADRSTERAIEVANEVPDQLIRSRLQAALSLRLAEAPVNEDVVSTVLAHGLSSAEESSTDHEASEAGAARGEGVKDLVRSDGSASDPSPA